MDGVLSVRSILLGSGPRFARDAFGPLAGFYICWRLFGLVAGVAAATAVSAGAYVLERRKGRPGAVALLSLALALVQATVGVVSGSARLYLAQPIVVAAVLGLSFVASAVVGRPLVGVFASEMVAMPGEVRASATYRRVFGRLSLAWGVFMLARSAVRLAILTRSSIDVFVVVNAVTGPPMIAAFVTWSVWYGHRGFRRSAEWGLAMTQSPG